MNCYLCDFNKLKTRKGQVRDNANLDVLECENCGLVTLSSLDHIQPGHYEDSGMHGKEFQSIESWLKDTDWDDQRRFDMLRPMLANKKILDFGCSAGGFLKKSQQLAATVSGIEPERRVRDYWRDQISIYNNLDVAGGRYDLITAFHVVEHLQDPRATLKTLAGLLGGDGRLVIEVPSSEDVLLTLYDSDAFQRFTYWSQHLYLFNAETLRRLANQVGLDVVSIKQYQRYPLSNHLHWLGKGKPGGHQKWGVLDSPELTAAYANALAAIGKCDTIIAQLELQNT